MLNADSHFLLRTRTFLLERASRESTIIAVISLLRAEHATGTLSIDLTQGGVQTIRFDERQRITTAAASTSDRSLPFDMSHSRPM